MRQAAWEWLQTDCAEGGECAEKMTYRNTYGEPGIAQKISFTQFHSIFSTAQYPNVYMSLEDTDMVGIETDVYSLVASLYLLFSI